MKIKLSGAGFQSNGLVAPTVLLTLRMMNSNSNPDPFSGVKSFEKADMRRILTPDGGFGRMFAETFQLPLVSPAFCTNGAMKVTFPESKVKSPWKPTKLRLPSMFAVINGSMIFWAIGTEVGKLSIGSDTGNGVGVGVGVGVVPAEAIPLINKEAVTASMTLFQLV
jgi:hypothetical protein